MSNNTMTYVQTVEIKIDGTQIDPAASIESVEVDQAHGSVASCRIVVVIQSGLPNGDFTVGKTLEVAFGDEDNQLTNVFKGYLVAIGTEIAHRGQILILEAFDGSYKLGSKLQIRTFVQKTESEMLTEIAGDCGLGADIDALSVTHEHHFQNCTNQEFIEQVCRRNGLDWSVTDGKLVVKKPAAVGSAAATYTFGDDLISFSARYSTTEFADTVKVQGWNPSTKEGFVGQSSSPTSRVALAFNPHSPSAGEFGGREPTSLRRLATSQGEAKAIADGIAARMASAEVTGFGRVHGNPAIRPGSAVQIEGSVDPRWNGIYKVTSARHHMASDGYFTDFEVGPVEFTSLVDVLGGTGSDGIDSGDLWLSRGVTVGIVTNNDDPDGNGRVKLKFPYLSDTLESDWARISSLGAGATRGVIFVPEVNDEVLVAFEHGDLRRPFVLGGLWNGVDKMPDTHPYVTDGSVDERAIVSRLGHQIRIGDKDGDDTEFVSIELIGNTAKAWFGKGKIEIVSGNAKTIELKTGDASILLDGSSGDITIKGANVKIEATQKIDVKSGTDLKLESGTGLAAKAGTTGKIEAGATMDVKASGPLTLKGALVNIN